MLHAAGIRLLQCVWYVGDAGQARMATISRRSALAGTFTLFFVAATSLEVQADASGKDLVAFNTRTRKYHCPECEWAIKCTTNCILIDRHAAQARGGIPCKFCRGICRQATSLMRNQPYNYARVR